MSYYQAIAIDFDATLTEGGPPDPRVLDALREARDAGLKLVLVTGRVVRDLLRIFSDAEQWFDAIVGENGAVIHQDGVSRAVSAPVPLELHGPLVERGVHFERGHVLLTCDGQSEVTVLEEIRRLGIDCQLVRNRETLIVLPSAVSKGSGLVEALAQLGVSYHTTIAVGAAENDLAMLRQCELGVAVGNAVESVQREADVVLTARSGQGVADFLRGRVIAEENLPRSRRWQVAFGHTDNDDALSVPASQVNVLVTGGSAAANSFTVGLFAERLIKLEYSVCVLDPAGHHGSLGRLPKVVTVGGRSLLPDATDIPHLLRQRLGSVVVDLSLVTDVERQGYMTSALQALREAREESGLPHWLIVDEAQTPFGDGPCTRDSLEGQRGVCLTTTDLGRLHRLTELDFDFAVVLAGDDGIDREVVERLSDLVPLRGSPEPKEGEALLARLNGAPATQIFELGPRFAKHVRRWQRYVGSSLQPDQAFRFCTFFGPTGARADNVASFRRELLRCEAAVLEHHTARRDFSKWLKESVDDEPLARAVHSLERGAGSCGASEELRHRLVEAVEDRYLP